MDEGTRGATLAKRGGRGQNSLTNPLYPTIPVTEIASRNNRITRTPEGNLGFAPRLVPDMIGFAVCALVSDAVAHDHLLSAAGVQKKHSRVGLLNTHRKKNTAPPSDGVLALALWRAEGSEHIH